MNRSYKAKIQLAGVVYLHRITDNRMGGAATKNLRMFRSLCGDEGLSCVVLATTMWGMVSSPEGEKREQKLMNTDSFWGSMLNNGSTVKRQDNGAVSALEILRYIIRKRSKITLKIQEEMAKGKTLDETSAGQDLQAEMEVMRKKYRDEMAALRLEMEKAARKQDRRAQQEIAEVRAELEKKLQKDAEDRERMRVTMQELQIQRNQELQEEREKAIRREMDFQREMLERQAQLEAARAKNASDVQLMEMQMKLALKEADNARLEREAAEKKKKGCVVM